MNAIKSEKDQTKSRKQNTNMYDVHYIQPNKLKSLAENDKKKL